MFKRRRMLLLSLLGVLLIAGGLGYWAFRDVSEDCRASIPKGTSFDEAQQILRDYGYKETKVTERWKDGGPVPQFFMPFERTGSREIFVVFRRDPHGSSVHMIWIIRGNVEEDMLTRLWRSIKAEAWNRGLW